MNPKDLLALLGRNNADPLVEAALIHYAVRNRPDVEIDEDDPDGPVVETQSWVKNSRAGIEFGFHDEAAWIGLDETEFGKRPMLLTQIYLYGQHEGVRPYQELLPFGLRLLDDRVTVRKKLEALESTRHSYIRDTWDAPGFRMTVSYSDGERCIGFVLCTLREPPLPTLGYALAQVPSVASLVELLDRPLGDPGIQQALAPLGLQDRVEQIEETGEADFRNPYGLTLDFIDPSAQPPGPVEEVVLSTITFLQERELDSRAWPGELPYAISFDDSPEMAVAKIGRPSDNHVDGDVSGYAMWHDPTFSVHIFYSTMDNRILRVSAIAPGLGATWDEDEE